MDDFVFKYGDLLIAVASLVQIQLATFLIGIGVAGFSIWKFFILHQSRLEEIIQQTTLESAKLHMAINERFELEEMSKISQRIAKHIDDKENFEIGESNSLKRKLLFDYLNEIELVCQFHDDKVLTTTQLYELMGYVIMELVKVRPILELIDNERTKKDGYPDYMDNFQKTYPILLKHQTKKWKKETLENIMTLHKD